MICIKLMNHEIPTDIQVMINNNETGALIKNC